jgi:hypothetical protein
MSMRKHLVRVASILALMPFVLNFNVMAAGLLEDNFNGVGDWYFTNFEESNGDMVPTPGLMCGTDACASYQSSGGSNYLRIGINPSATPGFYTNTDVSEVELGYPGVTNSGPWTATYGHPVTLETRVKWNSSYNYLGTGTAQGTSGVILWNSAVEDLDVGATGEYDHIGFTLSSSDVINGLLTGLAGTTIINKLPLGISRPLLPVDVNNWVNLKMVWAENILGIQTVTYYVNGTFIGLNILPVKLTGLSAEMWVDNQEPYLDPLQGGYGFNYPSAVESQYMDVDWIKVSQP